MVVEIDTLARSEFRAGAVKGIAHLFLFAKRNATKFDFLDV